MFTDRPYSNQAARAATSTRTKESIPDDKNAGEILVDTVTVDTVVNSMVTRSVQDVFQRTNFVDSLHISNIHRTTTADQSINQSFISHNNMR